MFVRLMLIACGGAAGTLARYGTGALLMRWSERTLFPWGTAAVNLLGCFLIGIAQGVFFERWNVREEWRLAIIAGFLGGYTTFSAYAGESAAMLREGQYMRAGWLLAINNLGGIALALAGYAIGRR